MLVNIRKINAIFVRIGNTDIYFFQSGSDYELFKLLKSHRIMFENRNLVIATAVATVSVIGGYYIIRRSRKSQPTWTAVAKVSKLLVHPIKSCRALTVDNYFACEQGLMIPGSVVGDRTFMVIYSEGVANIKLFPKMVSPVFLEQSSSRARFTQKDWLAEASGLKV